MIEATGEARNILTLSGRGRGVCGMRLREGGGFDGGMIEATVISK